MPPPSMYGPDRSLSLAAVVLVGGSLVVAAIGYLLTTSAGTLADLHRTRLAEIQTQRQARSAVRRPVRRPAPTARSREIPHRRQPPSALGRVPAWTGSKESNPLPEPMSQNLYELRPDMSNANLGSPTDHPQTGAMGNGVGEVGTEYSLDGPPSAGRAPLTADLGVETSGQGTTWRSEASKLGRRAQALSGALALLDQGSGRATRKGDSPPSSRDASTATAARGPHATSNAPSPPDDPPQVPVDGGLGWLAAAGAAYAANRLRKRDDTDTADDSP